MQTFFKFLIITTMVTTTVKGQIPSKWAQHTVEDTVNVPIDIYWDLSFKLNLEEIGSVGNYKDLPKIVKTTPVLDTSQKLVTAEECILIQDKLCLNQLLNGKILKVLLMN
jgi:hypothetical protein